MLSLPKSSEGKKHNALSELILTPTKHKARLGVAYVKNQYGWKRIRLRTSTKAYVSLTVHSWHEKWILKWTFGVLNGTEGNDSDLNARQGEVLLYWVLFD
ncbi:hypothetical protein VNO77_05894 [Canavalia gladiata]|uniref:Uncharacterized protein n=1 Tax=Canavalia gladiata TaxID=3824 RepID=A0AAN9R628_CANGL